MSEKVAAIETREVIQRQINLNTVEVYCPFEQERIDVMENCIADPTRGRPACQFKVGVVPFAVLLCNWCEEDGDHNGDNIE